MTVTLGCKVNQSESGGMSELLRARGHAPAAPSTPPEQVDMVLVNTCTVTAAADRKSRAAIRRLRRSYPRAVLGACGCLCQTNPPDIPGVAVWGGSADKAGFALRLEEAARANTPPAAPPPAFLFPNSFEALPDARPNGRTRLFLKVQDGCENRCTYCRIPDARGPCRSRPVEDVLCAAENAVREGVPELLLCGIEIASYEPSLTELAYRVCQAFPQTRIRLGSLYPTMIDDAFCARLSSLPNLCPHFHLSLQSGADATLARMGRRYGVEEIDAAFRRLRGAWKSPALSCDILCGFPGETEAEHRATLALLERLHPARLHVFPYSRREGTPAAHRTDQVPEPAKRLRAAELRALDGRLRAAYAALWFDTEQEILWEDKRDGFWHGHTARYVPAAISAEEAAAVAGISTESGAEADLRARLTTLRFARAHWENARQNPEEE